MESKWSQTASSMAKHTISGIPLGHELESFSIVDDRWERFEKGFVVERSCTCPLLRRSRDE